MINELCYISMNEHVDCILGYFDAIASFLCHVCFNYTLIYLLSLGGIEGGVALSGIRASLSVCQFVSLSVCQFVSCLFVSARVGFVVQVVIVGSL